MTPDPGLEATVGKIGDFRHLSSQYIKKFETRIMKFSPYSSPIPLVFQKQISSRNFEGFPLSGALNDGGVGKIGDFRPLSRHISETVQDMTKVVIDD